MFWDDLQKPIVGLSPMDGVTDAAFRYMVCKYGSRHTRYEGLPHTGYVGSGVDVIFTEFVSVDALHFAKDDRRERLLKTFVRAREVKELQSIERVDPLKSSVTLKDQPSKQGFPHTGCVGDGHWSYEVAQVFGKTPELFAEAAELVESLGFDGIDINMGCPAHKVEENGAGAGLIRTPKLAQEIVRVVKSATKLPVSIKTRIGVDQDVVEEWMESLMEVQPAMISLHGRTLRQLYQGRADWDSVGRAAAVVHKRGGHILGNGDIQSMEDGLAKAAQYKVDGFLIGRAAEGNPGIFLQGSVPCKVCDQQGTEPCKHKRIAWMMEHAKIYEKLFTERDDPLKSSITLKDHPSKWFMPIRKHLAWYCKGFPGASELRTKLVQASSTKEVEEILVEEILVESGSSW